jgi:transposase-like protein
MKKVNQYSDEFKKGVVKEVILGQISQEGARRKYGIGGSMTLPRWIAKYGCMIPQDEEPSKIGEKSKSELALEIEQLKRQLSYEKLRSQVLDTMITVAEREFKIPIRKKPGAKQSKK